MAQILDVQDTKKGGLVTLSIQMADGTKVTKTYPRNMIATKEQALSYLQSLEKNKNVAAPAPEVDLSFLKGLSTASTAPTSK
jgi:hypothetical protein